MNTDSQWSKQEACFASATRVWLAVKLLITTPVSLLANEFDVRSVFARASELGSCQSNLCHP